MRMCSNELWDVDGLGYLDELLDAFVLWDDYWKQISAIAEAHGGVEQCTAIRALLHRCHAIAWLLWVVEDIAPVARR